jgi:ribulose kinase
MENENLLAVGLDIGTGGVRAFALDLTGRAASD